MASDDSFFNQYMTQYNIVSISTTFIIFVFLIFLLLLMMYSLNHIFCKKQDLHLRVKIFTVLSTISFKTYIGLLVSSMIFYQFKMMTKYIYFIAMSYVISAIAKQSMYFLFLHTLYITFKRSHYQLSSVINKFVISLIILNFLIYLIQTYFWIHYQQNPIKSTYIWHILQLSTIPIEMSYSFFIVGLFGRRLFLINLERINQQKTQKYAHRLRAATDDIIKEHKQHIEKIKLHRSISCDTEHDDDDDRDFTETQTNTQHTVHAPSPRSLSFMTFNANKNTPIDHTLTMRKTPSLRLRKSMNIHRFNKENKELLDEHQLSMIDTAAKYTVLSSVAFATSLVCGTAIGLAEIWYSFNGGDSERYGYTNMDNKMYFEFAILFMSAFNAIISDLCVLLRYNDVLLLRMYAVFCCCCSYCCTHCFLYCSIRRIMMSVEDRLAQQVEAECDLNLSDLSFDKYNQSKTSLTPAKNINIDLQKINSMSSNRNNTTPIPTTPIYNIAVTSPAARIYNTDEPRITVSDNSHNTVSDKHEKQASSQSLQLRLELKGSDGTSEEDAYDHDVSNSNSNDMENYKGIVYVKRATETNNKRSSVASLENKEKNDAEICEKSDENHVQLPPKRLSISTSTAL